MASLHDLLTGLDTADRQRIAAAIDLMKLQALGSERYREDVRCWTKEDRSPVSVADLLHQTQVQQLLADRFPDDGLVCEEPAELQQTVAVEAARVSEKYYGKPVRPEVVTRPATGQVVWMLDPIDGTKGYLAGRYYAIALGYFRGGKPFFGAMAVPHAPNASARRIDNALAFAVAGRGAWIATVTQQPGLDFQPLATERENFQTPYRVAVSLEHGASLAQRLGPHVEIVKLDSQAKYLAVAANEIDAYVRASRGDGGTDVTWDHMPGALIATEAGARVEQFDGTAATFQPESVVRFAGGVACYRGGADGPLAELVRTLTR